MGRVRRLVTSSLNAPSLIEIDAHLAELHEPRDTPCPAVETVKRVLPFRGDLVTQSLGGRHGLDDPPLARTDEASTYNLHHVILTPSLQFKFLSLSNFNHGHRNIGSTNRQISAAIVKKDDLSVRNYRLVAPHGWNHPSELALYSIVPCNLPLAGKIGRPYTHTEQEEKLFCSKSLALWPNGGINVSLHHRLCPH